MSNTQKGNYLVFDGAEVLGEYDFLTLIPRKGRWLIVRSTYGNWYTLPTWNDLIPINDCEIPQEVKMACLVLGIPVS